VARQVTKAGGIDSSESIPGLLKRLKIRAQDSMRVIIASSAGFVRAGVKTDNAWLVSTSYHTVRAAKLRISRVPTDARDRRVKGIKETGSRDRIQIAGQKS
jgi:hypothetical protein